MMKHTIRRILKEEDDKDQVDRFLTRVLEKSVRNQLEDFHATSGTEELSQEDMMNINITIRNVIYSFIKDQGDLGFAYSDIKPLSKIIIDYLSIFRDKVINKKRFDLDIVKGIKEGISIKNQFIKDPSFFSSDTYMFRDMYEPAQYIELEY